MKKTYVEVKADIITRNAACELAIVAENACLKEIIFNVNDIENNKNLFKETGTGIN